MRPSLKKAARFAKPAEASLSVEENGPCFAAGAVFVLRLCLRHDAQWPAVIVLEKSHPFLGAVFVAVDHVRCLEKFDSFCSQSRMGGADVGNAEIKDRLAVPLALGQK